MLDSWLDLTMHAGLQGRDAVFGDCREIGVHHGRFFLAMEAVTPSDVKCFAVDLFGRQDLNIDKSGRGNYRKFMSNCERFASDPARVSPIASDSCCGEFFRLARF